MRRPKRPAITLNERESSRTSGGPEESSARTLKSPSANFSVRRVSRSMGRAIPKAIGMPRIAAANKVMPPAVAIPTKRRRTASSICDRGCEMRTTPRTSSPKKTGTATNTSGSPSVRESRSPTAGVPPRAVATSGRFEKLVPNTIVLSLDATTRPSELATMTRGSSLESYAAKYGCNDGKTAPSVVFKVSFACPAMMKASRSSAVTKRSRSTSATNAASGILKTRRMIAATATSAAARRFLMRQCPQI